MPQYLIKIADYYLEWSTIVDAPVTYGMLIDDFEEYYVTEYGIKGMEKLPARLARMEFTNCSSRDGETVEELIIGNRAGPDETELTLDQIYRKYCLKEEP